MIDLAVFLKRNGYKPDQVQDFIPGAIRYCDGDLLHGHRPLHERRSSCRTRLAGQEAAAGAHAVFQARELLHGA